MFLSVLQNNTVLSLCQLILFFAASVSQNIKNGDTGKSSSNFSEAVVDANEILSIIEQQSALCPYIPLCSDTNRSTSTFVSNKTGGYPCCSECSCHVSCVAEGTCCPDFVYRKSEVEAKYVRQKDKEKIKEGMECVRTHHGSFNKNSDGYQMIASCPGNFTNKTIKERCEIHIHIQDTDTLVDVIPVFENVSSSSYKNIFCFLCNKADKDKINDVNFHSVTFWYGRIYCYNIMLYFMNIEPDPFMFWRRLLQYGCNIVFYNSVGTEGDSKPCTFNTVIETCKSEFAASKLETQCKHYKWPITSMPMISAYKTETFKNYACMLCNGRTISENCFQYTLDSSLSSIFLTKAEKAFVANLVENKPGKNYRHLIYINQTIDRYFPDSKGNIPCRKGFILDKQKNECRQMLCPEHFFLNNGTCFPLFYKTEGIFYFHLFKIVFSASENVEDTEAFEDALVLEIEKGLNKKIGDENYNLTLWSNAQEQNKINQKFFVLVVLDDKYASGNYLECLKVFYELRASVHLIEVRGKVQSMFRVELDFTMDYTLRFGVFVGVSGEVLRPRRPYNERFITESYERKDIVVHITIPQLCYRIAVSVSDTHVMGRRHFLVKRTNKLMSIPNFQRLDLEMDQFIIVCLEYALNDVASANKYIFAEYLSKSKPPRKDLNHGERGLKDYDYKKDTSTENGDELLERSIVTIVVTLIVVFVVVGSRVLLKRLLNRMA